MVNLPVEDGMKYNFISVYSHLYQIMMVDGLGWLCVVGAGTVKFCLVLERTYDNFFPSA